MKVLITGAGGGGSNNLIRDLRSVNENIEIIGSNIDIYQVAKSIADKSYILPIATDIGNYIDALNKLIEKEKIKLIIPNNDREVSVISRNRDKVNATIFLPSSEAVDSCHDKWIFYNKMKVANLPVAETYEVETLDNLEKIIQEKFHNHEWLWCRLKTGSGSKGATRVQNYEQALFWVKYWNEVRGIAIDQFLISEFLPGRDLAVQSTWKDGELKLMKIAERLSYYGGDARPSGMSSSPQLAKTIRDEEVLALCQRVAKTMDSKPNGNFNFDLKQNNNEEWCFTEVNIGRFCMITSIFDLTGKHSMIDTYIKLAFDENVNIETPFDIEENRYLIRELDTEPLILTQDEIDSRVYTIN